VGVGGEVQRSTRLFEAFFFSGCGAFDRDKLCLFSIKSWNFEREANVAENTAGPLGCGFLQRSRGKEKKKKRKGVRLQPPLLIIAVIMRLMNMTAPAPSGETRRGSRLGWVRQSLLDARA